MNMQRTALSSAILLALATPQAALATEGDALDAGAPISLSQDQGYLADDQSQKGITQDANGNFIAVWVDYHNYDSRDIIARRFTADGTPIANEFVVNSTTTGNQVAPKVAASPDGAFVVVFVDQTDNFIHARLYGADGVALGNQFQVNTTSGYTCDHPTVAMAADGSFIVAWEMNSDVFYRRYAADGTALDGADVTANTITSGYQRNPVVAMNPAGNFVISWDDNASGDMDIQARRYSADGTALDTLEVVVNETLGGDQNGPSVAMDVDGDYVVAWGSGGGVDNGVYFRRFAASGTPQIGETAVALNADYVPQAPFTEADFYGATVGMGADGRFVITLTDRTGVDGNTYGTFMQRYSSSGTPAGGLAVVGDWSQTLKNDGVHMDADGDIVVMYENYGPQEIYAERYEGAGQSVDLSLSGSRDTDTVGGAVTYTFTTTNNGNGYALAVSLEDVLPSGVSYTGFTDGIGAGWACSDNSGTVTCTLPSLAPGAQSSVDLIVDTSGVSGSTLDNTATIDNAVTDSDTSNNSDTVSLGSNAAPVISGTPVITGTSTIGSTLGVSGITTSDADGDTITLSYQWYSNGVAIAGATNSSYTITSDVAHTAVSVTVTAADGFGGSSDAVTSNSRLVFNSAPVFDSTPTLSGTSAVGDTLSISGVSVTDSDGDALSYEYVWYADGAVISGAISDNYTITSAENGKAISAQVSVSDGYGGSDSATTAQTAVSNTAPVISGTPTISGTASVGGTLSVSGVSATDSDGDTVTLSYQWTVDGADIAGATASSYTLTTNEAHKVIGVDVTASDPFGGSSVATTGTMGTVTVNNSAPAFTATPLIVGSSHIGDTLAVVNTDTSDADGDSVTLSYRWKADGADIAGATNSSYTVTSNEAHKAISVTVTASDGNGGSVNTTTSGVSVGNNSPTFDSVPIISGSAVVGGSLSVSGVSAVDADGDSLSYSYQWRSNGVAISGATGSSYTLSADEAHSAITVTVTATDGNGGSAVITSNSVSLQNSNPAFAATPTLSGTPDVGEVITVSGLTISDTDNDSPAYSYQWYMGGNLVGTGSSYTLASGDEGKSIMALIIASDGYGGLVTAIASGMTVNSSANNAPTFTDTPAISGTGAVGESLSVSDTGTSDLDGDSVTLAYQWKLDGANISGATSGSYTVQESDAGGDITVTVTASDGYTDTNVTTAAVSIADSSTASSSGGGGGAFGWLGLLFGLMPLWRRTRVS